MVKGAKTIAQYCILKWLDANFYMQALKVEQIDGATIKITDINGDTAYVVYRYENVYLETEKPSRRQADEDLEVYHAFSIRQNRRKSKMIKDFKERILSGEPIEDVSVEAVQFYSDKILEVLNPIHEGDIVFALTALKQVRECLAQSDKEAAEIAETLDRAIGFRGRCLKMPEDTPKPFVDLVTEMLN